MTEDYAHIVEGCCRHDRRAQRALYDTFAPMAMGVCMRYATDRDVAQDLLQDGMVQVFEKIGQLRDPQGLGAWIYRLMVNTCLQYLRKRKEEVVGLPENPLSAEEFSLSVFDDPFAMEEVVLALQQLPPSQRMAFNLVEVDGYTISEVAQRVGCSEANVRALLSRAKGRLREILTPVTRHTARQGKDGEDKNKE